MKCVLLNFDLEEFDIPEEYGQKVSDPDKIRVTREGVIKVLDLLDKLDISATFFTTVFFAQREPSIIQRILARHEPASHNFSHSNHKKGDIAASRIELEKITGRKVYGFRQPRFSPVDYKEVLDAGYTYNSSENPIWLPGRYMGFSKPRLPYYTGKLLNLPVSASPVIRYPLFWLSFKHSPLWLFRLMSLWNLNADGYLNIFFHPWEFTELDEWNIPSYIKHPCGEKMLKMTEKYLLWLKEKAVFFTCSEFAEEMINTLETKCDKIII